MRIRIEAQEDAGAVSAWEMNVPIAKQGAEEEEDDENFSIELGQLIRVRIQLPGI